MVPAAIIMMHALPRLPNLKINREALQLFDREEREAKAAAPPLTATEALLADIRADVFLLGHEALHECISYVARRQHCLRANFDVVDGQPTQIIWSAVAGKSSASFDASPYDPAGVRRFLERYGRLLDAIASNPDHSVEAMLAQRWAEPATAG